MSQKEFAFVMMPIAKSHPELEDVLNAIKRICKKNSIKAIRADDIEHSGRITDIVLGLIRDACVLIADLSLERPNVYYELGVAHGLGKGVILIAKEGQKLHFDIKDYNVIFYRNITELEEKLDNRIVFHRCEKSSKRTPLPQYIIKTSVEEIREETKVIGLAPLEEGVEILKIPNGRFGYTVPWVIRDDGNTVVGGTGVDRVTLSSSGGGTAVMEVHKDHMGNVHIIAFVNDQLQLDLHNCDGEKEITGIIAFSCHEDFPHVVAIPVDRILNYSDRHVSKYDYIADITIV